MADAVTAVIGATIMIWYMMLLVLRLDAPPFTIVCLIGLGCMAWAFWGDDWKPVLKRDSK